MARGNNTMPDEVKAFIVQALACFDTPTMVATAVKAEFEIEASPQAVQCYDPTKYAGRKLSKQYRQLFEATRKAFIDDATQVPIAHRSMRLRSLNRMAQRAEKQGNLKLAADLHKQAAEEMGNAYTNRREVTGKDGSPLPTSAPSVAIFALPDNGRG